MKIFISFSTEDKKSAISLYGDLSAAGAEVFRYGQSGTAGSPVWNEILDWISKSDVFIVLLSQSALRSAAVKAEIEHANYSFINTENRRPSKLIPAMLERGLVAPIVIQRFAELDLCDYRKGLKRLLRQLNLPEATAPKAARTKVAPQIAPTFDFEKIFAESAKKSPPPVEQEKWKKDAAKILWNYQELKPPEISKKEEAEHVDSLLAEYSGKKPGKTSTFSLGSLDNAFLGIPVLQKEEKKEEETPFQPPVLSNLLLDYDPDIRKEPLEAPILRHIAGTMLSWDEVSGATGYVLEKSDSPPYGSWKVIYRGPKSSFMPLVDGLLSIGGATPWTLAGATYRVKATGGVFRADSPWSNSLSVELPKPLSPPTLSATKGIVGTNLTWTAVPGATGYVLQRSLSPYLSAPVTLYDGDETSYLDVSLSSFQSVETGPKLWDLPLLKPEQETETKPWETFWVKPKHEPEREPWEILSVKPGRETVPKALGVDGLGGATVYYRVEAKGAPRFTESAWSEIVKVDS